MSLRTEQEGTDTDRSFRLAKSHNTGVWQDEYGSLGYWLFRLDCERRKREKENNENT